MLQEGLVQAQLDLSTLNPSQKQAVTTTQGRLLVLAGAGSGKTRVLTMRIAYLILSTLAKPIEILGLTFTNKAALEMRHRLDSLIGKKHAADVTLATFHGFCMQVLRKEAHYLGYTPHFTLYDEHDIRRLINAIARDILEHESQMPSIGSTLSTIALAKNKGLNPEEIEGSGSKWSDDFNRQVYQRLTDSLRAHNAMDFDHLLWMTVTLFERRPDVLKEYQARYRYILIDEYQDTNPIQSRLAELLASKENNLCVVGDDDQSIYGFRGADVHHILQFQSDHVIKLEQNYRSTSNILRAANTVIGKNTKRHKKSLWSDRGEGSLIEVFYAPTETDEADAVILRAIKLKEAHNLCWSDIAILYRSNALSRPIELALIKSLWKDGSIYKRGIPYQVFGGTEFYERKEVKDLLAYLRVIVNPQDHEGLLRIINHPRRGIGETALDCLTSIHRREGSPLFELLGKVSSDDSEMYETLSASATRGINQFLSIVEQAREKMRQGNLQSGLRWLVETIDYKKAIFEEVKSDKMREFKWSNVEEFIATLGEFEGRSKSEGTWHEDGLHNALNFVSSMTLEPDSGRFGTERANQDSLTLMTFHSAKGLEFPACFLIGMEDHIIPHEKSVKEGQEEEERRLMYVAITRAMRFLTISMATKRKKLGQEITTKPSRFLFDIPKELMRITKWDFPEINAN